MKTHSPSIGDRPFVPLEVTGTLSAFALRRLTIVMGLVWSALTCGEASGADLSAVYSAATAVPVTASSYTATGSTVNFTLNFAPPVGTTLMVVNNTGLAFINGTFSNLAQGQPVQLTFQGTTYNFVASYFGGTGNDLVLLWANNEVVAWGNNFAGQGGNDGAPAEPAPAPVNNSGVLAGKTIISVATGDGHSLAVCSDGTVAAWGNNSVGELGNGTTTDSVVPVAVYRRGVLAGKTVIAVAANVYVSLALCSDGTIAAWGDNQQGELGNGSTIPSSLPVLVDRSGVLAGKTTVAIAAGELGGLALCSDGTLASWGWQLLGNNTKVGSLVPVAVDTTGVLAGRTVVSIAAGAQHNLVLCSDGTLASWGNDVDGQHLVPIAVDVSGVLAGKTVTAIAAGAISSLVLCSDGTLADWGAAYLGNNSRAGSLVPVAVDRSGVLSGKTVIAISGGAWHSLALCSDGTLASWGENTDDQLGNGIDNASGVAAASFVPVLVSMGSLPPGSRFLLATSGSESSHSLGIVALPVPPPPAPRLAVVLPAGTNLISGSYNVLDFGALPVGASGSKILTLRNTGNAPLKIAGVTLAGPNHASFAISRSPGAVVPVGSYTNLIVSCKPRDTLGRSVLLHIASNDPTAPLFEVTLAFNWPSLPGAGITGGPASVLVGTGQPAVLLVDASGGGFSFQWNKNNVAIPGATRSSYNIAPAALANAGIYTVIAESDLGGGISSAANLGVVKVTPSAVLLSAGGTLTLAAAAAGPDLTYRWRKNGVPLVDGPNPVHTPGIVSGATTSTLSITHGSAADAGAYTCLVSMPDAVLPGTFYSLSSGVFTVHYSLKPALDNSGKDVNVQPLPVNAIGIFNGLVERDETLGSGCGGTVSMVSLNSGVFTGKLTLGAQVYGFTSQFRSAFSSPAATATAVIVRHAPLPDLTFTFTINPGTGELMGAISDGGALAVNARAWRNPWSRISNPAPSAATYTSRLAPDIVHPQGAGDSTLTVFASGAAIWAGKMADGSAVTSSSTVGPSGAVPVHCMLYANTGSVQGWVTASVQPNNDLRLLDGTLDWFKVAGIPLHTLTVVGSEDMSPTTTVRGR